MQPSREMPIETVCAGNIYKGKMGEGGEAQQTWILRDHVQLLPLQFLGAVGCLFVLLPRPHTLQMSFMRACQPPTMPESHQVSSPLKKKLVRAQ